MIESIANLKTVEGLTNDLLLQLNENFQIIHFSYKDCPDLAIKTNIEIIDRGNKIVLRGAYEDYHWRIAVMPYEDENGYIHILIRVESFQVDTWVSALMFINPHTFNIIKDIEGLLNPDSYQTETNSKYYYNGGAKC